MSILTRDDTGPFGYYSGPIPSTYSEARMILAELEKIEDARVIGQYANFSEMLPLAERLRGLIDTYAARIAAGEKKAAAHTAMLASL